MYQRIEANIPVTVTPAAFADMFCGNSNLPASMVGVCGRVIRGCKPRDFDKLSFAEGRRLAWVLGPRGLHDLLGKRGADIVLGIGKSRTWLQEKLAEGIRWKLVVLPQTACRLANWDGLFALVAEYYPEIAPKLLGWAETLKDGTLVASIDQRMVTADVKDNVRHPLHMSVEWYRDAEDTSANARLFLWHSLGVNDQFTGNGYTKGPDGTPEVEEYLVPNCRLADLPDVVLIDLDVS